MKIAYSSDLHLDIWGTSPQQVVNRNARFKNPNGEAEVLVLAGDIAEFINYDNFIGFFEFISKEYPNVIMIAGNHEYYKAAIDIDPKIKAFFKDFKNIHFLQNNTLKIGDVRFFGSTLWTDFKHEDKTVALACWNAMNDYVYIRNFDQTAKLTPDDTLFLHKESLKYLQNSIKRYAKEDTKKILVSHHGPSYKSIDVLYWNQISSYAYCSDLIERGLLDGIDIVIHGHVHARFDYEINGIRVLTNPLGYPNQRADYFDYMMDEHFTLEMIDVKP